MKAALVKAAAVAVGVGVAVSLVGCSPAAEDDNGLIPLTVYIPWTDMNAEHTPMALALENGYFEDEGLDVSFAYATNSANVINLIATSRDQVVVGWTDSSVAASSINEGRALKIVGTIFRQTPIGIVSSAENGVESIEDLAGKKVAAATGALPALLVPSALEAAGMDPGSVEVVTMAGAAMMPAFLAGQVDGIASFNYLNVPPVEANDRDATQIAFADYGLNMLNLGFVVTPELLESNPDAVRGFLAGVVRGWEAALEDPEASIEAGEKNGGAITAENRDQQLQMLEGSLTLLYSDASKDLPIGCVTEEDWQNTQDLLVKYVNLQNPLDVSDYYTNEYLPNC